MNNFSYYVRVLHCRRSVGNCRKFLQKASCLTAQLVAAIMDLRWLLAATVLTALLALSSCQDGVLILLQGMTVNLSRHCKLSVYAYAWPNVFRLHCSMLTLY